MQELYSYEGESNRLLVRETVEFSGEDSTIPEQVSQSLTYNHANRWYELYEAGELVAQYIYNAQGQRTRKVTDSGTTIYHYDLAGTLISETTETGELIKDYLWLNSVPIAQIGQQENNAQLNYLHTDHLYTSRLATNPNQQIVWRWEGEAFGSAQAEEISLGDPLLTVNLRFPGQYFDEEAELHYNYYRTYDPSLGRYLTADPIGILQDYSDPQMQVAIRQGILQPSSGSSLNHVYNYVDQNPTNVIDPFGLFYSVPCKGFGCIFQPPFGPVCGSKGNSGFIPDGIWKNACQKHDDCYGTCGKSKAQCDTEFAENGVRFYAWTLTQVFTSASQQAYDDVQKKACDDCK